MAAAMDKLGTAQNRIVPIFITIDPERDKPEVLKKYLAAFGPRFMGSPARRTKLHRWKRNIGSSPRKQPLQGGTYSMDHSSVII